ncbi:NACHT and WD repeat domain-containing protein 2 isoform 1-T2 [Pholidichthys leucotaenia]
MHSRLKQRDSSHLSCVKIYLCSNPEDSVVERRALRERVFPTLTEHCRGSLGLDIRVIDPFESSDPSHWPDTATRRQMIQECRESSAGPFLVALVGHQYGSASFPAQVEVSEFQQLLQESQQAGLNTQELERVYHRDENTIPPSYRLRTVKQTEDKQEGDKRKRAEEELRELFHAGVSLCVHSGIMTPERAKSYYRSVLDADLHYALDNCPEKDIIKQCVVYVHKIINAKGDRGKGQLNLQLQQKSEVGTTATQTEDELLSELCDSFLPSLITSCQLLVYATTTECDPYHGYTTARRRGYAESLCQQVHSDLVGLIDSLNISQTSEDCQLGDALSREQAEQEQLCDILSQFYDVIRPEEEMIKAYVEQTDQQLPLLVTGGPCIGKTVLLAHCTQQIKSWLADIDPVVISQFCSLSINPSPRHLLSSLCFQIAHGYHHSSFWSQDLVGPSCIANPREYMTSCSPTSVLDSDHELCIEDHVSHSNTNPSTFQKQDPGGSIKPDVCLSDLKERLSSLLLLPSAKQPLVLILDGLDQLEDNFGAQIIWSLPSPLPPFVKLIFSISSNRTHLLETIKLHFLQCSLSSEDLNYVCVQLGLADRKQCAEMLASLLRSSRRRVTSGQQALVNQALTRCCLPLYARLLQAHTSLWNSDSDVTESSLPDGVHSSISALLDQLEQKHSSSIVAHATSYLTLSRTGLTEAELTDLLSSDGPFPKMKVSQVDVERLLLDLKRFLVKRVVANSKVLFWVSRHFRLVVVRKYCSTHEVRRQVHSAMADYFSGQKCKSNKDDALKLHTDRQPFIFSSFKNIGRVNLRKVIELPYHLQQSGRWKELECELLMSLRFHQAMVRAGLLGELVVMLESNQNTYDFHFLKERLLLASILKSSSCFLQSSPLQLLAILEQSLLPYLEVFPAFEGYVQDIRNVRKERGSGLVVALCPGPSSVPPLQCLRRDDTTKGLRVTGATGTECGIVAVIMDDGSAWIWKPSGYDLVKLSLSCEHKELKFAGVKSSGQFLLFSLRCNKLFVWDVTGSEQFMEIKDPLKTEVESSQTHSKLEGFVAYQKKLSMWWKDESFVSVFDISTETLTHLQCQSCVTCLTFSSDGFYIYCGQEEGIVSTFDTRSSNLMNTCLNSTCSPVTLIILCEDSWRLACVDWTGNITLWDVTAISQSPRLLKESSSQGKSDNILGTEYLHQINTLLVCQSHHATLWDTCSWELWDKFLAPRGKAFTQAMLSQNGQLFLALLDSCASALVWRVSTGECILSLEMTMQPYTLLKVASDIICLTYNGSLMLWDFKMIEAAGETLKMGDGVKEVVVEQTGRWFYTADGSETVWRWSLDTGFPHASFLHDSTVEKLQLSRNGIHLVSLSNGEIYIWQTETGENIVRVSDSRATDILITPNDNFGVSISERGLSRVWKLAHGSIVCSIHLYLSDAQVSPESTFLIGLRRGDLLAASLWSGSISKRFSCVESSEQVIAFHTLSEHPDFVVVMAASGSVYTWKVAEETVCRHFQLPCMFCCQPQDFQMSSNGNYALLSTENCAINLLDLSRIKLCSLKAEAPVIKACLGKTGLYVAYICLPSGLENSCACCLHARPTLTITRLSDGERMGTVCLPKAPLTMAMSKRHCVFVGFEDGSVGVYSVLDTTVSEVELVLCKKDLSGLVKQSDFDRVPFSWFPRNSPNIIWP